MEYDDENKYKTITELGSVSYCEEISTGRKFFKTKMRTPPDIEMAGACIASVAAQFAINMVKTKEEFKHIDVETMMVKLLTAAVASIENSTLEVTRARKPQ